MADVGNYKEAMQGKAVEELPLIKWEEAAVHVSTSQPTPVKHLREATVLCRLEGESVIFPDLCPFSPCKGHLNE